MTEAGLQAAIPDAMRWGDRWLSYHTYDSRRSERASRML